MSPILPFPRPGRLLPFALQKLLLERALAVTLAQPLESGALDFLYRRWVEIDIVDAGLRWYLTRGSDGLLVLGGGVHADVTFSGRLRAFVALATRRVDPDTLFFQRRLAVTGDTALGLQCKNVVDAVEFDRWPAPALLALETLGALLDTFEPRAGSR